MIWDILGAEEGGQLDIDDYLVVSRWLRGKSWVAVVFEYEVEF